MQERNFYKMRLLAVGFFITLAITLCVSPGVTPTWGQTPSPTEATVTEITSTEASPQPTAPGQIPDQSPLGPEATSTVFIPVVTQTHRTTPPPLPPPPGNYGNEWFMVAANPERTSSTPEQVSDARTLIWYRPIEAYISQNVQLIAANGLIYVSTSRGLYALHAADGSVAWQYDTDMPLGNSPTVIGNTLYVAGYDRKLHALNAITGAHLWEFSGAKAGYDTNPLVVDGRVFIGNRDGFMYAVGAHGAARQGELLWKYQTGGPVHLSAAYSHGVVYFASNDNYAYALRATDGELVWKSQKLPGDGYHSYWPVIYGDKVIFSAAPPYRNELDPGTRTLKARDGTPIDTYNRVQMNDLFPGEPDGALLGPYGPAQDWSHGRRVMDASRVTEYLEDNPNPDPYKHKPWRRTVIVLNTSDGSEYTFDSDGDGFMEYAPIAHWGTKSGSRYPPVVGPDAVLYFNNLLQKSSDPQGQVMAWRLGSAYVVPAGAQGAIVEPQALSVGGSLIYRNLCCDRTGDFFDIYRQIGGRELWSYNLSTVAPGYDPMWTVLPGWPRLQGWYKGNSNSINGIYHNHGEQNPIIPYAGRLFVHRSNTVFAFGNSPSRGLLPLLRASSAPSTSVPLSQADLVQRLESEVLKIIQAGHLRPGYYNNGQFALYAEFADYFSNPGDTLFTLSIAYPHLSANLQQSLRAYLQREYQDYFNPVMYSTIGWADGAPREALPMPPDLLPALSAKPKAERSVRFSWDYPQHNFYAMWKYVQIFPEQAGNAYTQAKRKLQVPIPSIATTDYFRQRPYELNAYIAGYVGFLKLQELAGMTGTDAQLRASVTNELNRAYALRVQIFSKDTYWVEDGYQRRSLNVARNFMMLVPELGAYLRQHALSKVQEAVDEYQYIAPYWFVTRYEAMMNEGVMSPLYNYPALFQAKALVLGASSSELTKYIDVPAFERGDLFHIQNLVYAIEAP